MTRTFPVIAALVLWVPLGHIQAEVDIPLDCRVSNLPPGRCGWCALETVGRHQRIKSLIGLTERKACQARPEDLVQVLDNQRITYRIQYRGSFDTGILREAIEKNHGAVVGFREIRPGAGGHIVTLVNVGPEEVRVIDPNDSDHRVRTLTRDRFMHWWDGFVLVLTSDPPK
jgi:hypothetical protein